MELELTYLIDALPGLVWTALPNGGAEFINRRWCEYTGLSLDQAAGFGWQSAIHPEDRTLVLDRWRSFLESGQGGALEIRLRRYDGEYRRFLFSTAPLADKSGQVVKWCGINTDIEERLKTEETLRARESYLAREQADAALKTSEAELRFAYAHLMVAQRVSAMGSFTSDLVADEHTWSDEFYRICEFEPGSEVSIQKLRDIVHPDDVQSFDAVIERSIAGQDARLRIPNRAFPKRREAPAHSRPSQQTHRRPTRIHGRRSGCDGEQARRGGLEGTRGRSSSGARSP